MSGLYALAFVFVAFTGLVFIPYARARADEQRKRGPITGAALTRAVRDAYDGLPYDRKRVPRG